MTQLEYEDFALLGEVPPYKLQLLKDTGALLMKKAESGDDRDAIEADDIYAMMRNYLFVNRFVVGDVPPAA